MTFKLKAKGFFRIPTRQTITSEKDRYTFIFPSFLFLDNLIRKKITCHLLSLYYFTKHLHLLLSGLAIPGQLYAGRDGLDNLKFFT